MNKIVYVFLIVFCIGIGSTSFAENNLTSNITDSNVKSAVEKLNSLGIINGMEDGSYHPEEMVTREQLAKIMIVTLGLDNLAKENKGGTIFSDVEIDRWSAGYINVAAEKGLIQGYPDGTFQPEKTVTYEESLTMMVRCLGYTDEYVTGSWPQNYIQKSDELQITKNIVFSPQTNADRGAVAIIVANALNAPIFEENPSGEYKTLLSEKTEDIPQPQEVTKKDTPINGGFESDRIKKVKQILDTKVQAGEMTQEESDQILNAIQNGDTSKLNEIMGGSRR